MKLLTLSLLALILSSCAHNTGDKTETTMAKETTEAMTTTAVDTCKNLVTAAQNKDFKSVLAMTMMPQKKSMKLSPKSFDKMHKSHMPELKDLNCLREMISDNRAVVETESKGVKRLVPFVKSDNMWKFDSKTYMSFYAQSMKK